MGIKIIVPGSIYRKTFACFEFWFHISVFLKVFFAYLNNSKCFCYLKVVFYFDLFLFKVWFHYKGHGKIIQVLFKCFSYNVPYGIHERFIYKVLD